MPKIRMEITTALTTLNCCRCGVLFAITEEFEGERRKTHADFWCPNGHPQAYMAETEADRLKRELSAAQRATADWRAETARVEAERQAEKKQHAATKGQLTKLRARAQNGVCVECNRHFVNVKRHMATKHA